MQPKFTTSKLHCECLGQFFDEHLFLIIDLHEVGHERSQEKGIQHDMPFRPCCPLNWDKLCFGQLPGCKMPNFSLSYLGSNHPQGQASLSTSFLIYFFSSLDN